MAKISTKSFSIEGFRKSSMKLNKAAFNECLKQQFYFHNKKKYSFNIEFLKHFFLIPMEMKSQVEFVDIEIILSV